VGDAWPKQQRILEQTRRLVRDKTKKIAKEKVRSNTGTTGERQTERNEKEKASKISQQTESKRPRSESTKTREPVHEQASGGPEIQIKDLDWSDARAETGYGQE
jgi:D-alanyl-D-alanine carboxypeptidase